MRLAPLLGLSLLIVSSCAPNVAHRPTAFPAPARASADQAEAVPQLAANEAPATAAEESPDADAAAAPATGAAPAPRPTPTSGEPAPGQGPSTQVEVEATLNIVVDKVGPAAVELRRLVRQHGGVLVEDVVDESGFGSGRFVIRVPTAGTDAMLDALDQLGKVRNRQVSARDVGKEFFDAQLRLENLKVTMARYEQILAKADKIPDLLSIETELARLRAEVERIKGNLRWMRDRVARSTIHVNIASLKLAAQEPAEPEAKFYPGLRGVFLEDMRGDSVHQGYLGGGISLRPNRSFSLDIDGLRRTSSGSLVKGLDVLLVTLGGEMYSQFLGNGQRRFGNPFLGWRMGYARFLGENEFAIGATAGVELVKTRYVRVDLAVRGLALIGENSHFGVQPELTVGFAF